MLRLFFYSLVSSSRDSQESVEVGEYALFIHRHIEQLVYVYSGLLLWTFLLLQYYCYYIQYVSIYMQKK